MSPTTEIVLNETGNGSRNSFSQRFNWLVSFCHSIELIAISFRRTDLASVKDSFRTPPDWSTLSPQSSGSAGEVHSVPPYTLVHLKCPSDGD